ncbi:uncharacterized protein LOC117178069 isoform X2 [Belonocnema kinseyi]|nr:uncharacterized protein LOC117178069 isoform X2 [Belonocnema kinseyi]
MRGLLSLVMLLAAMLAITKAYRPIVQRPRPGQSGFPSFPGQGPFNPKPQPSRRLRRSPEDKNKITVHGQKEGGSTSYNIDYERKLYENKYGSIGANVGVNKNPYSKPESHVGIGGTFHFR